MVDKLGVHFANMFPKHVLPFIIVGKLVDENHPKQVRIKAYFAAILLKLGSNISQFSFYGLGVSPIVRIQFFSLAMIS